MAFRDTSERYEYIYGSNVKKLDRETAGSTKSGSTKRAQPDFWHLTGSIR